LIPVALTVGVFLGMLLCLHLGYRLGSRRSEKAIAAEAGGMIAAAVLGLLGLLLAFAFAGGMARLDARRQLVVQEANAVGSASDLLDVLPPAEAEKLRRHLREYVGARLRVYELLPDRKAAERQVSIARQLHHHLWNQAIVAAKLDPSGKTMIVLLPALNALTDVATARTVAMKSHLPPLIFFLLVGVAFLSGLVAGYDMGARKTRGVFHALLFAASVSVTVFAIIDLDFPQFGLIRLEAAEKALVDAYDSMH
jgi:hypothetical protein